MGCKLIVPIAAALVLVGPTVATAEDKPADVTAVVSAKDLTREQFQALPPEAVIDINGEQISKRDFQARNAKALAEAAKQLQDHRTRAQAAFEARRKELLDQRQAAIADANKKVEAEIAKLTAADTAKHGPNWEARKKQAAALLERAEKATPTERSELEKRAADLLAPMPK